jgi:D-alanyl-lipoteichoic acid acyltransferase DltB (MBOAT superfamily)
MNDLFSYIFQYNPKAPLIFTQPDFWIFFMLVLAGFSVFYKNLRSRNTFLFLASVFFYYKSGGICLFLLLFAIIFNYYMGLAIERRNRKKLLLATGVIANLLLLGFFKYAYFITQLINEAFSINLRAVNIFAVFANQVSGSHFDIFNIILPVGISFFTFQAISYLVDVYCGKMVAINDLVGFGFFKSFFPQLVAGPIVRAVEFGPQLEKPYSLTREEFGQALYLIMAGLIKKMLVSDYISVNFVDRVFDQPGLYTGFENLMAVVGYAVQIYCDFSGYTDIAIGIALLFGFRLPLNFNSPYKAKNITDFWRRWHITLSTWLRDYLYIPLGGNRKGKTRTYINLFITMLLGGLWHGADLRFVLWGGLHGAGLAVHKIWQRYFPAPEKEHWLATFLSSAFTFAFICFTWVFFRAGSLEQAGSMLHHIGSNFGWSQIPAILGNYAWIFGVITFALAIHILPSGWKKFIRTSFISMPAWTKILFALLVIFVITQIKTSVFQPFIYFQF